jgi:hypothetical protein
VTDDPTVDVVLLRYPLRLGARSTQYYNDVFREFALIANDTEGGDGGSVGTGSTETVPARLLALVDALGRQYEPQTEHEAERDEALARGEEARDFRIAIPASAGQASRTLDAMLDESDEFCRQGALLTLAAEDDVVAFRRWYLDEVARQAEGGEPRAWPGPLA